jgi:hypothetical protein
VESEHRLRPDSVLRQHGEPAGSELDAAAEAGNPSSYPSGPGRPAAESASGMSLIPACPQCQDNMFVRHEQVISGRRVSRAYYCGRCHREWRVESESAASVVAERRNGERRQRSRQH